MNNPTAPQIHYLPSEIQTSWLTLHSRTDVRRTAAYANLDEIESGREED